ncbi:MAG: hypothetical protein ACK505_05145 [Flavobacteriales bacterium]
MAHQHLCAYPPSPGKTTDIHEAMERAMEAYVKEVLEKRRKN